MIIVLRKENLLKVGFLILKDLLDIPTKTNRTIVEKIMILIVLLRNRVKTPCKSV